MYKTFFYFQYEVHQNLLVFTREEKSFTTYTLKKKYFLVLTYKKYIVCFFCLIYPERAEMSMMCDYGL